MAATDNANAVPLGPPVRTERGIRSGCLWPQIATLSGDQGARSLLEGVSTRWVNIDGPKPADIDTPDAYTRAVGRFHTRDSIARPHRKTRP